MGKLAKMAPIITHSMYADDLVVIGEASVREVHAFKVIMTKFVSYTGLTINPDKSTIWFSSVQ